MHHFFLFSLHVTAHSHPIYETPYGTVRHNVMETWAPISKSNVARDGKNENKLYGHRKPCHTLWTLKPCVKFQTVMWTLAVSNFERHSTWRLAVLKFERLFVTCDATIMYYLWHLFKPRLTRSIFILFSFFSFFCFCIVFVMPVRSWLRPYIPLFIGVTSCIWGVAILVYHQMYDWCMFWFYSRNILLIYLAFFIVRPAKEFWFDVLNFDM